jgi:hypothetical protein
MPKFSKTNVDDDDHQPKPADDEVRAVNNIPPPPPPPIRAANNPATNSTNAYTPPMGGGFGGGMGMNQAQMAQMNPAVGLAQAEIDSKVVDHQMAKENEHWMKAYWRPCMGWLYMAMCAFDFIIFPLITIILPIFQHNFGIQMPYNEWKSLTLSNGGLIHLAFGAILGVAAFTRSQEKIAGKA